MTELTGHPIQKITGGTFSGTARGTAGAAADEDITITWRPPAKSGLYQLYGLVDPLTTITGIANLDYAMYANTGGTLEMRRFGSNVQTIAGGYTTGDVLELRRDGATGTVAFYANDILTYTFAATDTTALSPGLSMYADGDSVRSASHSIAGGADTRTSWEAITNSILIPNPPDSELLFFETGTVWASGAASVQTAPASTDVRTSYECLALEREMHGLAKTTRTISTYTDIDYAIHSFNGALSVYELGVSKASVGTAARGDILEVRRDGATGVVTYHQNDTLLYTSLLTDTTALRAGSSIRTAGYYLASSRIKLGAADVAFVDWGDVVGLTVLNPPAANQSEGNPMAIGSTTLELSGAAQLIATDKFRALNVGKSMLFVRIVVAAAPVVNASTGDEMVSDGWMPLPPEGAVEHDVPGADYHVDGIGRLAVWTIE